MMMALNILRESWRLEKNALRYVAGYVFRKIRKNLELSQVNGKDDMIFWVLSFAGDEEDEDGKSEVWLNSVDRGGLWHINDVVFMFFLVMEEEARRFYTTRRLDWFRRDLNPKQKVISHIQSNADVLFQWALLTPSLSNELSPLLLEKIKKIITLYVTTRDHGFATSCIEMYKQNFQSSLQKKKALRKSTN